MNELRCSKCSSMELHAVVRSRATINDMADDQVNLAESFITAKCMACGWSSAGFTTLEKLKRSLQRDQDQENAVYRVTITVPMVRQYTTVASSRADALVAVHDMTDLTTLIGEWHETDKATFDVHLQISD